MESAIEYNKWIEMIFCMFRFVIVARTSLSILDSKISLYNVPRNSINPNWKEK